MTHHRLIIHAGLHKTGTTSIQGTCLKNAAQLKELGLIYPAIKNLDGVNGTPHSPFVLSLFSEKIHYVDIVKGNSRDDVVRHYQDQYAALISATQDYDVLISAESIAHLSYLERLNFAQRLSADYPNHQLTVYVVVREYYSILCSAIQQQIKMGRPTLDSLQNLPSAAERIKDMKRAFPENIVFLDYHTLSSTPLGLPTEFLRSLGYRSIVLPQDGASSLNASLSNLFSRVLDMYNQQCPYFDVNRQVNPGRKYLKQAHRLRELDKLYGSHDKFLLNRAEFERIRAYIEQENNEIQSMTGISYSHLTPRFSEAIERNVVEETLIKILAAEVASI